MSHLSVVYETKWINEFEQAKRRSAALGRRVLFSIVKKVDRADPLLFYLGGRDRYAGQRFFWQDQSGEMTFAGLGTAKIVNANGLPTRIADVRDDWRERAAAAVKTGQASVEGTGPILFGAFAFDAMSTAARQWRPFRNGLFYVPQLLLTSSGGRSFLTVNFSCKPDTPLDKLMILLKEGETLLRKSDPIPEANHQIVDEIEQNPEKWTKRVREAIGQIKTSALNKVVLARTMKLIFENRIQPEPVIEQLRLQNKGNYLFSFESGDAFFVGATPERLVRKKGTDLFSACLAGSAARGQTAQEDERLAKALLGDQKNRQEHQYVVASIKEALEKLCFRLEVPDEPVILKNAHIQHLYTPVHGRCFPGASVFDFVDRLHPTPALGGTPKEDAVQWIRAHESLDRGLYGAPIGWCDTYGNGDFAVGIRSALVQGREAALFAGCGIVGESIPEKEYEETAVKFRPMRRALGGRRK